MCDVSMCVCVCVCALFTEDCAERLLLFGCSRCEIVCTMCSLVFFIFIDSLRVPPLRVCVSVTLADINSGNSRSKAALSCVLANPAALSAFVTHSKSQHCDENILFWVAVRDFKAAPLQEQPGRSAALYRKVRDIFFCFVWSYVHVDSFPYRYEFIVLDVSCGHVLVCVCTCVWSVCVRALVCVLVCSCICVSALPRLCGAVLRPRV